MNWSHVKRVNRRASARKAKRERKESEQKVMHERLGGTVTVGELRAAKMEVRRCRDTFYTRDFDAQVWTLRGREWRLVSWDSESVVMMPHLDYRDDLKHRDGWVPLTAGARKWALVVLAIEQ